MTLPDRLAHWFRPAAFLGSNPVTLAGGVLTTSSGVTMVGFWFFEVIGTAPIHPYLGLILFLVLPAFFVIGLVLMPVGVLLRRRSLIRAGQLPQTYPQIDFSQPILRHAFAWFSGLTIANVIIFGVASYRGVEYMDSVKFCGQTCHTVMQPEFVAYSNSPHQRVACIDCHIGPGASWFVRSKLSGLRQVYAVTFHTYHEPIPAPVEQLRPARETCEQCHWPQAFTGDKVVVRTKFADDEQNTRRTTILVMKIGGHTWQGGVGIHGRHLDARSRIQYISTDRERQTIPEVKYIDDTGKQVEYLNTDEKPTPQQLEAGEQRLMDCVDCHNRPTHIFQMPQRAVDLAMSSGRISPDLPYIKKKAVEVLTDTYPDRDAGSEKIASKLNDFYRTSYPDLYSSKRALIDGAVQGVQAIYLRNIFPDMKIGWGTYASNLGHIDSTGCFRCHDGNHATADGRIITNKCTACHSILAMNEENPKVLAEIGVSQ